MQSLVATLGETMRWDIGAYWRVTEDGTLVRSASWWSSNSDAEEFVEQGSTLRLASGEGFPGLALQRGEPVWVRDFTTETTFPRIDSARRAGLHAAICVPVVRGAEIVGVLEFLTAELRVRDSLMTEALATVGEQVGELLGILEERQALVAGLARLALTDQLTSLPNRRAWEEGLTRELARATRDGHPVCVAVIDVDDFKRYNDRHGHQAGDALLAATVTAWQAQLRGGDLLARYGGDEFAAVIPAWPLDTAMMVIDRFRAVTPSGQTCSAGVACWDGIETAVELFGRADAALYKAKQAGRDRTVAA
jgi:diguanylate cyclase (GGDEF)-like protein